MRCFRHTPSATILPYHLLLGSLADSEGRLLVSPTVRSQWHSPCRRYWKTTQASVSVVAVLEALGAIAGRT